MDSVEIIKLAGEGNISAFQDAVSSEVISRLQTKVDEYRQQVAAEYSDSVNDE